MQFIQLLTAATVCHVLHMYRSFYMHLDVLCGCDSGWRSKVSGMMRRQMNMDTCSDNTRRCYFLMRASRINKAELLDKNKKRGKKSSQVFCVDSVWYYQAEQEVLDSGRDSAGAGISHFSFIDNSVNRHLAQKNVFTEEWKREILFFFPLPVCFCNLEQHISVTYQPLNIPVKCSRSGWSSKCRDDPTWWREKSKNDSAPENFQYWWSFRTLMQFQYRGILNIWGTCWLKSCLIVCREKKKKDGDWQSEQLKAFLKVKLS